MSNSKNTPKFEVFNAGSYKVGIVVAKFNSQYTEPMLEEAKKVLTLYKVPAKNIKILKVAGSMEIPVALQALADLPAYASQTDSPVAPDGSAQAENGFDCLVAIGVIIKGETAHFDYVAKVVSEGVLRVSLDYKIPIGFGVIAAYNEKQVKARLYQGKEAMIAALQATREIKTFSSN